MNMTRKDELLKLAAKSGTPEDLAKSERLIEEIIFVENQLAELKKLPFIKIDPKNPARQKSTPAAKLYKEMLQQYNNSYKLLLKISGDLGGEPEEESPLRLWLKSKKNEQMESR